MNRQGSARVFWLIIAVKLATIGLIVASTLLGISVEQTAFDPRVGFLIALFVESIVFVSSISPLSIFSVIFAVSLINNGDSTFLMLGYISALGGNFISYFLGRTASKRDEAYRPSRWLGWSTYWHPQLASITGFEIGLSGSNTIDYFKTVVPPSLAFYALALLILNIIAISVEVIHLPDAALSIALLLAWILVDIISFRSKRSAL